MATDARTDSRPLTPWFHLPGDPIAGLIDGNPKTLALALASVRASDASKQSDDAAARNLASTVRVRCVEEFDRQRCFREARGLRYAKARCDEFFRHDNEGHLGYWRGLVAHYRAMLGGADEAMAPTARDKVLGYLCASSNGERQVAE